MKAAIYLRKSTNDDDKRPEEKSVELQRRINIDFINRKGWTLEPEHDFVDDGISGGEWTKRPAFQRMMAAARAGEFDVLVIRDFDRFGRDTVRYSAFIEELVEECGVKIWLGDTGQQIKFDTAIEQTMVAVQSGSGKILREQASKLGHGKAKDLWSQGRNFGGRVFGYDNVWIYPDGTRQIAPSGHNKPFKGIQTFWQINEAESVIVCAIYTMYADGHGNRVIAKTLNGDSAYSALSQKYLAGQRPAPPRKGTGSWSPASVWEILHRDRYNGVLQFGETRKIYRKGTKKRKYTGQVETIERPELRIVPPELWERVQSRIQAETHRYKHRIDGKPVSKPDTGRVAKYLLSGMARCKVCGGAMIVSSRTRHDVPHYICGYRHNRGETVCTNDHRARTETMDGPILEAVEQALFTPQAVSDLIDMAVRRVQALRQEGPDKAKRLQAEQRKLTTELKNLLDLAIGGGAPKSIKAEILAREQRLDAIEQELAVHQNGGDPDALGIRGIRQLCLDHAERFRILMYSDTAVARQVLRKLNLDIRFFPVVHNGRKSLDFHGTVDGRPLLEPGVTCMASPRGFEPRSPP